MAEHNDVEVEDRSSQKRLEALGRAADIAPRQLIILGEAQVRLPFLDTEISFYKVLDADTGESRRIALDGEGRAQDADELLDRERGLARERYGNLQPALYDLLEHGDPEARLPVMLRYAIKEDPIDRDKRELDARSLDARALADLAEEARRREQDIAEQTAALHREVMEAYDVVRDTSTEGPPSGPFVRTRVPLRALRELSRDERIAFIGLDQEREVLDYPTIPGSLPTTRTDTAHAMGSRGAGVNIAVLESGGLNQPAGCFNVIATQDGAAAPSDHMTKSVGIIGNTYSGGGCSGALQGYAPDADVLVANEADYQDRYDWARDQGVNVVTMSWHFSSEETSGALHSRDIYFDYWVTRFPYPSVFTSAGNEAAANAYASGKGYNFFGVGNVNNDGDGDRCNDTISSSSSRKNPTSPHADHEVPAIAAPGSRHDLLGSSFGGTSCATPVSASVAAVLMSRNASLKIWPEAIRAILLATANYQRADAADYSKYSDGADGTGMINSYYGVLTAGTRETGTTAQYRAHDYGLMTAADFNGGFFTKEWTAQTYTTSSRIRVALTWNSKVADSGGAPVSSVLDADLDLWVYDPNGNVVAFGSTWDNSWEFVELTPTVTGTYTIKVRGYSVPADFSSWYGVAWTTHYDLC